MSDTSPKNQDALLSGHQPARVERRAKPRELLFTFVDRDGRGYRCELLDHGSIGVEAQITSDDQLFFAGRRWPSRSLAETWAQQQRRSLAVSPG